MHFRIKRNKPVFSHWFLFILIEASNRFLFLISYLSLPESWSLFSSTTRVSMMIKINAYMRITSEWNQWQQIIPKFGCFSRHLMSFSLMFSWVHRTILYQTEKILERVDSLETKTSQNYTAMQGRKYIPFELNCKEVKKRHEMQQ